MFGSSISDPVIASIDVTATINIDLHGMVIYQEPVLYYLCGLLPWLLPAELVEAPKQISAVVAFFIYSAVLSVERIV